VKVTQMAFSITYFNHATSPFTSGRNKYVLQFVFECTLYVLWMKVIHSEVVYEMLTHIYMVFKKVFLQ
jgi:hypothetical protein